MVIIDARVCYSDFWQHATTGMTTGVGVEGLLNKSQLIDHSCAADLRCARKSLPLFSSTKVNEKLCISCL